MSREHIPAELQHDAIVRTFRDAGEYIGRAIAAMIVKRTSEEVAAAAEAALPALLDVNAAAEYLSLSRSQI